MRDLSKASSLASALGVIGAWSQTLLMQVCMNSWKKLLFRVGAGEGAGLEVGVSEPGAGLGDRRLIDILLHAGIVVEMKRRVKTK